MTATTRKDDWRSKPRINWTREQRKAVYGAVKQYWNSRYTVDEGFERAQVDVGIPANKRRKCAGGIKSDLTKLYGSKPTALRTRDANGEAVDLTDTTTSDATAAISVATATAETPTIETPSTEEQAASAPISAVPAASSPGSLEHAIGVIGKAFGGLIRDALADALTRALTNPEVAASFAEVLRPAMRSALISEPEPSPPSPQLSLLPEAAEAAQEHKREREDLPRILVAGLLPAQIEEIKNTYSDRAALRFWRSDETVDQLRRQLPGVDAAVASRFMSHPPDHVLSDRQKRHGLTFLRCHGGMSSIKHGIERALKVIELERAGHIASV